MTRTFYDTGISAIDTSSRRAGPRKPLPEVGNQYLIVERLANTKKQQKTDLVPYLRSSAIERET
jgi:hypothetical protein